MFNKTGVLQMSGLILQAGTKIWKKFLIYVHSDTKQKSVSKLSEAHDRRTDESAPLTCTKALSSTRRTLQRIFKNRLLPTLPGCNDAYFINDLSEFYIPWNFIGKVAISATFCSYVLLVIEIPAQIDSFILTLSSYISIVV